MIIRQADFSDISTITLIYTQARLFMQQTGNPHQWGTAYPSQNLIEQDIAKHTCYVCCDQDLEQKHSLIEGVFVFIDEEDETYAHIEDGEWLNTRPYCTIHRIAVLHPGKGIASFCLQWAYHRCHNLRIDTHVDNVIMQHVVLKNGFQYCGRIYTYDGTPRLAYQKTAELCPDRILSLISRIHSAASLFIKEELEHQGLTKLVSSHGNILWQLASQNHLSMKELAHRINRDKSTTTVLVRKLETAGYITRHTDCNDNRITYICLTAKGAQYTQAMKSISQHLIETCYQGFSKEEQLQVYLFLSDIAQNFARYEQQ